MASNLQAIPVSLSLSLHQPSTQQASRPLTRGCRSLDRLPRGRSRSWGRQSGSRARCRRASTSSRSLPSVAKTRGRCRQLQGHEPGQGAADRTNLHFSFHRADLSAPCPSLLPRPACSCCTPCSWSPQGHRHSGWSWLPRPLCCRRSSVQTQQAVSGLPGCTAGSYGFAASNLNKKFGQA